jgi:DNA-binding response OmpR family regulator
MERTIEVGRMSGMVGQRRKKILLLDDSEIVREMVSAELEEQGYDVIALDNQFALSNALGREKPDLVLVDVGMPALDGDVLVRITKAYKGLHKCPMVLYSDRSPHELSILARECGADGFIRKTSDGGALAAAIETFFQR